MAFGPHLTLRHQQRLVITPALRQSLSLLQVPTVELAELVQQELMENPFLQEADEGEAAKGDSADQEADPEGTNLQSGDRTKELSLEAPPAEEGFSIKEWEDYFSSRSSDLGYVTPLTSEEETQRIEQVVSRPTTLREFLLEQLRLSAVNDEVEEAAILIIGNLDHHGYLRAELVELAQTEGVSLEQLERALALVQSFDPVGVGARTLQECLLIQLEDRGLSDSLAAKIIREQWEHCEFKRWSLVAKALSVSISDVLQAVEVVTHLNPKPGRNFSQEPPQYVTPDVVVEEVEGRYVIRVNEDGLPLLRVSRQYMNLLRNTENLPQETKKFVEEKLQSAIWLIKGIEQRKRNIYKVTEAIIEMQRSFFERGDEGLKPLTLQEVADRVGIHESTVSRVTMHKYMQTPLRNQPSHGGWQRPVQPLYSLILPVRAASSPLPSDW